MSPVFALLGRRSEACELFGSGGTVATTENTKNRKVLTCRGQIERNKRKKEIRCRDLAAFAAAVPGGKRYA